jgi:AI-2 transport protein TqsA
MSEPPAPPKPPPPRWRDPQTLHTLLTVTCVLIIVAAGWFLLKELGSILRPLLIAVFLAYVLMPYHSRWRKQVGSAASLLMLGGATAAAVVVLALVVYASALGLQDEMPRLQSRAVQLTRSVDAFLHANAKWAQSHGEGEKPAEERLAEQLSSAASPMLSLAAGSLVEACVVALYLMFLLLGASRFPDKVRAAYPPERAEELLQIAGQVNAAIVSYLRAKVRSSLFLAVPVGIVLGICGVKFALLWAVLTFLCNFIPYVGSVIAYTLPIGFAFLQLDPDWRPFAAAGLVMACHLLCAAVVEPLLIGNAVGLSPLVVLGSLAFWGLLWGIAGMFLAVPLTVVAVIVLGHFEPTRPLAKLLGEG